MAQNNDVIDLTPAGELIDKHVVSGQMLEEGILNLEIEGGETVLINMNPLISSQSDFGGKMWLNDHQYEAGDIVSNGQFAYMAIVNAKGSIPSYHSDEWVPLIPSGGFTQLALDVIVTRIGWKSALAGDSSDTNSQAMFDDIDKLLQTQVVDADIGIAYSPDLYLGKRFFLNITQENGKISNPTSLKHGQFGKFIVQQGKIPYDGNFFSYNYKFDEDPVFDVKPYMTYIYSYEVYDENIILCKFDAQYYLPFGANTCIVIGSDGVEYGSGPGLGTVTPVNFSNGQLNYKTSWQADGTFLINVGDTGDEQLDGVSAIHILEDEDSPTILLNWIESESRYRGENVDFATYLISTYPNDTTVCLAVYPLKDKILSYDFSKIEIGNE